MFSLRLLCRPRIYNIVPIRRAFSTEIEAVQPQKKSRHNYNQDVHSLKMPVEVKPSAITRFLRKSTQEYERGKKAVTALTKLEVQHEMYKFYPMPMRKLKKEPRPDAESWKKLHVNIKSVTVDEMSVSKMLYQANQDAEFHAKIQVGVPLVQFIRQLRSLGFSWDVVKSRAFDTFVRPIKGMFL